MKINSNQIQLAQSRKGCTTNIPKWLFEKGHYCVWKMMQKDDGTFTKPPYNPYNNKLADPSKIDSFSDIERADIAKTIYHYDGIGIGMFDNLAFIDIDDCIDAAGILSDLAKDILEHTESYAEISPSGNGLHIYGTVKEGYTFNSTEYYIKNDNLGLEIYISGMTKRYGTLTFKTVNCSKMEVLDITDLIEYILPKYMAKKKVQNVAPPVISNSNGVKSKDYLQIGLDNSPDFKALYEGQADPNNSENDLALVSHQAYWCNGDPGAVKQAFLDSPYCKSKDKYHTKKATERKDYLDRTIEKALQTLNDTAQQKDNRYQAEKEQKKMAETKPATAEPSPSQAPTAKPEQAKIDKLPIIMLSEVPYKPPQYLFNPYIQIGKINMISADPSAGKTSLACMLTARVTTGQSLDGMATIAEPQNVLVFSVEDDAEVLQGRIKASGGDLSRVALFDKHKYEDLVRQVRESGGEKNYTLKFDDPLIEQAIKDTNAKFVWFDPMQAFLGDKVDMNAANQIRPIMSYLEGLANRTNTAILILSHVTKATNKAIYRTIGSIDIIASTRSAMTIGINPDNPDERILVHIRCSNAKEGQSFRYRIGDYGASHFIAWSDHTEDDLLRATTRKEIGYSYDAEPLVAVIRRFITDNPCGGFISYDDVNNISMQINGYPINPNGRQLRNEIDRLQQEILKTDHILIITKRERPKVYQLNGEPVIPESQAPTPGIHITSKTPPTTFQTAMNLSDKEPKT